MQRHVGNILVAYRKQIPLTQRAMAERLGISARRLNDIERGRVAIGQLNIERFAKEFGIDEELLTIYVGKLPKSIYSIILQLEPCEVELLLNTIRSLRRITSFNE